MAWLLPRNELLVQENKITDPFVLYIDDQFNPTAKELATMARISYPDGRSVLAIPQKKAASLKSMVAEVMSKHDTIVNPSHSHDPRRYVTESPEFKKWFGDSRVVDESGDPLVVYHGTKSNFDTFRTSRSKSANRMGAYFTESADAAGKFLQTSRYSTGDNIKPVYLSVSKPLDLRKISREDIARKIGLNEDIQREMLSQGRAGAYSTLEFLDQKYNLVPRLKKAGYDGIVFDGDEEGMTWVAFKPEQIKSAIGNSGKFNTDNPSITKHIENDKQHSSRS